jgi:hypothetical protein
MALDEIVQTRGKGSHFVIAEAPDGSNYYAQFALTGRSKLRAEIVGNEHVDGYHRLTPHEEDELERRGWKYPSKRSHGNWSREFSLDTADLLSVASEAVNALADVYGVNLDRSLLLKGEDGVIDP